MSLAETPSGGACPACIVPPDLHDRARSRGAKATHEIQFALPAVHCATCMATVERGMAAMPGVAEARVNLTLKRVRIQHDGTLSPEDLVARLAALGYEALPLDMVALSGTEMDRTGRDLLMRLGVAFFAMMNIMLLSVAVWSGADGRHARHLSPDLGGHRAADRAVRRAALLQVAPGPSLRAGRLGMDVPISLAIILASSISVYETLHSGDNAYFDAAVMLTFFLLGGRYLDHRTRAVARSAAQELAALEVPRALRIGAEGDATGRMSTTCARAIWCGCCRATRVPVDGVVTDGESEIDRSLLTGETLPARADAGRDGQRRRGQPDRPADPAGDRRGPRQLAGAAGRSGRRRRRGAQPLHLAGRPRGAGLFAAGACAGLLAPSGSGCGYRAATRGCRSTSRPPFSSSPAPARSGLAVPAVVTAASGACSAPAC